jgi:putative FmdB family regulatory protein
MPLYEYECQACGHRFETIQKFSDAPIETCPKCGGAVHKLQSAPAFHLKGSGWYITDYARKDQGGAAGGKDKPSGESSDKSERADRSDKAQKAEKAEKAGTSESPAKTASEPAAAPAKADASSISSTPSSGAGPSGPTK